MKNSSVAYLITSLFYQFIAHLFSKKHICLFGLFIFISFNPVKVLSQTQDSTICGIYKRPNPPSLNEVKEQVFIDRFGNYYLISELLSWMESAPLIDCDNDAFSLNFGAGFTVEQEETICEVFNYLSQIMGNPTPEFPANILVLREFLSGPTGATGSPNWDATCGIANSTIVEKFLGGGQDISASFPDGILRIDSDIPDNIWHTLADDASPSDPDVGINEIDLFSTALHEALHILGFASRIGADGSALDIYDDSGNLIIDTEAYSRWDTYIYSELNSQFLIESVLINTNCCDDKVFNFDDFSNMPDPVDGACSNGIVFNGNTVSQNVNNLSDLGSVDPAFLDFAVANKLSHLHRDCNNPLNEKFVMHPAIPQGQAGVNRLISDTEISMMCDLGYPISNICEDQCFIAAQNDFIIREYGSTAAINIANQILNNDVLPDDYEITFDFECGNLPSGAYFHLGNSPFIFMAATPPPPGLYYFCYTLVGCEGECDEGIVYLSHGPNQCENDCNLFCNGNFENFLPKSGSYLDQVYLDFFEFDDGSPMGTSGNSVDVYYGENDNQLLLFLRRWINIDDSSLESPVMPLSSPVEPGCTISVSFKATGTSEFPRLQFYASSNSPCLVGLLPECITGGFNDCPDYLAYCMTIPPASSIDEPEGIEIVSLGDGDYETSTLEFGDPNNDNETTYPFDFDIGQVPYISGYMLNNYSFQWTNNTSESINYITVFGNSTAPPIDENVVFIMDDIEIFSDCSNSQISISPTFDEPTCIGNIITINYEICNEGTGATPSEIILTIGELPQGIAFGAGGDFINGEVTLEDVSPNSPCVPITVALELVISNDFTPGTSVAIPIEASIDNACWMDSGASMVYLDLEYCCDLPMEVGFTYEDDCGTIINFTSLTTDNSLSHAWDFTGNGNTESVLPNPSYDFMVIGTYNVSHTVVNNCGDIATETLEVIVSEDPSIDPSFTFEDELCTFNVQFTSTSPSGDHQWIYNGTVFSTDANPSYDFSVAGTYQVTHILTIDCATAEETLSISTDVEECGVDQNCECINGVNIPGPTTNITDVTNESSINSSCVSVNGTLIINDDFSFNNCNIYMQPGAEIIINTDYILNIYNSNINGCGELLWQGITVQQKGTLNAQWSIISDAREAIQPLNGSKIQLYYNTFDRNYVGIYTTPSIFGKTIFSTIYNNKFLCTDNLLHNYEEPDLGDRSFAGVWMNQTRGINIGQPNIPWNVNSFYGVRNGIIGIRSAVNIHNVVIQDLVGQSLNPANLSGVGVYTDNSFLKLSKSNIENGFTGVLTERTNIQQFDDCQIQGVRNGIRVLLGQQKNNFITNNEIHCQSIGILMANLDNAALHVFDNDIYIGEGTTGFGFAGISIQFSQFQQNGDALIDNNRIYMNNTFRGFHLNGVRQLRVYDNVINEIIPFGLNSDLHAGISLSGGIDCRIRDNTITGLGTNSPLTGMRISSSTGTLFCCNTIDATRRGVSFVGECDDTNLRVTDIHTVESIGLGLHLHSTATLGDQIEIDPDLGTLLYGNIFSDGTVNSGATYESTNPDEVLLSRFPIDQTNFPQTIPFPIDNPFPNQWFPLSSGTTLTCSVFPDCNIISFAPPGGVDDRDIKTATGNNSFGVFTEAIQWEAARHLYRKMNTYSFLQQQNNSVDSFYTVNQSSVLGQMNAIQNSTSGLYIPDSVLWQNYMNGLQNIENILPNIDYQDSLLFVTVDSLHPAIYLQKDSLIEELANNFDSVQIALNSILADRVANVSPILNSNSSAFASEGYEINLQTINDIYLQTIAQDISYFDSLQLTQIETIAGKCPLLDGNAVFFARALLSTVKDTIFDDATCDEAENRSFENREVNEKSKVSNKLTFYPNPAKEEVILKFDAETENPIEIKFYTITGEIVKTIKVGEGVRKHKVDLSNFDSGIYFCKVSGRDQEMNAEKLIILK